MTAELMSTAGDIAAAIEAGKQLGNLRTMDHDGSRYVLIPEGFTLEKLPFLNGRPNRIEDLVETRNTESFIAYFKRFATEHSIVMADVEASKFIGFLDYHEANPVVPNHRKHLVTYDVPETPEWQAWQKKNGVNQSQEDFAAWIEDMALDIIEPDAATMLEIACTLQATKSVNFSRGIRLDNGQTQLQYIEQTDGTAGQQGRLTIPTIIKLGVQIFHERPRYEMEARFRYRFHDHKVLLRYELVRPEKVVSIALQEIYKEIQAAIAPNLLIES